MITRLHYARRARGHEPFYLKRLLIDYREPERGASRGLVDGDCRSGVITANRLGPDPKAMVSGTDDGRSDGASRLSAESTLVEGEPVLVRRREGDAFLLSLRAGPQTVEGIGVIDLSGEIGKPPGGTIEWAGATYRILRPSLADILRQLRRRAQIVTPKDAQQLLFLAQVGPGSRVAEAGAGSGALTVVLAHAVGAIGHVVSYDRRSDFLEVARVMSPRPVSPAGSASWSAT